MGKKDRKQSAQAASIAEKEYAQQQLRQSFARAADPASASHAPALVYMSDDTRQALGAAADYLPHWVGPDREILVVSRQDLPPDLPPPPDFKKFKRRFFFPVPIKNARRNYLGAAVAWGHPLWERFRDKIPHARDALRAVVSLRMAGGLKGMACAADVSEFLEDEPVGGGHPTLAGYIYFSKKAMQSGMKTIFSNKFALPKDEIKNIFNDNAKDLVFLIAAHEASHAAAWARTDASRKKQTDLEIDASRLQDEWQADEDAIKMYNHALRIGAVSDPDLPEIWRSFRAINSIAGDFEHATNPVLDTGTYAGPLIAKAKGKQINQCYEMLSACETIEKNMKRPLFMDSFIHAHEVFYNSLAGSYYKNLYRTVAKMERAGRFDECQYQQAYATQFLRAIEKHVPSYAV